MLKPMSRNNNVIVTIIYYSGSYSGGELGSYIVRLYVQLKLLLMSINGPIKMYDGCCTVVF